MPGSNTTVSGTFGPVGAFCAQAAGTTPSTKSRTIIKSGDLPLAVIGSAKRFGNAFEVPRLMSSAASNQGAGGARGGLANPAQPGNLAEAGTATSAEGRWKGPMMHYKHVVTSHITIGDQPTEDDLKSLKEHGYVGVINLRNDGEPEQPLSTTAEGAMVRALGLEYLHYGVGGAPLTEAGVKSVRDFLDHHVAGKVLVHCRKGGRAAALVVLQQAKLHHWTADEAITKGKAMGLEVDGNLRIMVENFLRDHPTKV